MIRSTLAIIVIALILPGCVSAEQKAQMQQIDANLLVLEEATAPTATANPAGVRALVTKTRVMQDHALQSFGLPLSPR